MNHLPVVQMNAATLRVLCRQPGRETVRERNRALQGLLRTKTPGRNVREVTSDQPSASSICNQQEKNRAMRSFKWHSHPCKWQNKKIKKKKRITTTTTTTTTVDNKNTVNSASKSQLRQRRLIKQGSFNIYIPPPSSNPERRYEEDTLLEKRWFPLIFFRMEAHGAATTNHTDAETYKKPSLILTILNLNLFLIRTVIPTDNKELRNFLQGLIRTFTSFLFLF